MMMTAERIVESSEIRTAVEREEFNLVALLKPRIFMDGNQYCVLFGESLMEGIAGFGDTPVLAVFDFNKAWHRPLPPPAIKDQPHD
jgi:hypothetical protein